MRPDDPLSPSARYEYSALAPVAWISNVISTCRIAGSFIKPAFPPARSTAIAIDPSSATANARRRSLISTKPTVSVAKMAGIVQSMASNDQVQH